MRPLVWFLEVLQRKGLHLVPSRGRRSLTTHAEICPVSLPLALWGPFHCEAQIYVWKISQPGALGISSKCFCNTMTCILSWMRHSCLPTCPLDPLQRFTKLVHVLKVCFRKSWIFYSNNASKNYWHISLSRWLHSWTVKWNLCIETCLNQAQHFSMHWMCIFPYILCSFKPKSAEAETNQRFCK